MMKRYIPLPLIDLIVNLFSGCFSCIKWEKCFRLFQNHVWPKTGISFLPDSFALYIADISNSAALFPSCYIILYADDILLISPSVMMLNRLLHVCETELNDSALETFVIIALYKYTFNIPYHTIDMAINLTLISLLV